MNKALFFAVILLALSVAQGEYAEKNFHKFPTTVYTSNESVQDLRVDINLKTSGSELSLSGARYHGDLNVWSRKINSTDLSVISTSNFEFDRFKFTLISGKYAIDFLFDNETTLKVNQYDFEQNISLPSILIAGKDASAQYPQFATYLQDEEAYIGYPERETLTLVRFKVGETEKRDTVVIPVQAWQAGIGMAKVSDNEVLVTLQPGIHELQEILVDFEKGTYQVKQVSGFISGLSCTPYVTKKSYGSVCQEYYNSSLGFHITRNSSAQLETLVIPGPNIYPVDTQVYGDYLMTISNEYDSENVNHLYYELWDIESMRSVSGKVVFLEDSQEKWERVTFYQGDNGSLYVLLQHYDIDSFPAFNLEMKVGILLSGDSIEQNTTSEDDKLIQYFLA